MAALGVGGRYKGRGEEGWGSARKGPVPCSSLAAPPLALQSQAWALGLVVGFISLLVG